MPPTPSRRAAAALSAVPPAAFAPRPAAIAATPALLPATTLVITLAAVATPGAAEEPATLPAVTVRADAPSPLDRPAAVGTALGLTPLSTPASVETVGREQLEARGDARLVDAITRTTGITSMGHPGNSGSSLSARGFIDTTSVMRLYDGLRQYGGVGLSFPFHTWAVEEIEVLRGPASVIHGDGAIGAVVNVVPKKPGRGPIENAVEATIGSGGRRGLAFGSGGAIDTRWAYRLDASVDRDDGWVDRGERRERAISGALRLDATRDLRLTLTHADGRQEPMRYFGLPLIDGRAPRALRERNYNVADGAIVYRDRWTELGAEWTPAAGIRLRSRLYHIRSDRFWRNVETYQWNAASGLIDRSGATEIAHDQTQTGNTTDIAIDGTLLGLANRVAVGIDVSRSRFRHSNNTYTGTVASVDPLAPQPGLYASPVPFIPRYRNTATSAALFAEDRLSLTERWSVVAGLRRDHLDLDRADLVAGSTAFDRSYAHTGWRLGTVYQWQPERSVYAQLARAADPVSSMLFLSPANSIYDLSYGRQVEVGFKQALPARRGDFTLAAYRIVKNNLLTRDSTNPALRVQVGERSSQGLEASLALNLTKTLRLEANAAVLRARYDDFTESVGGVAVSRDGKRPSDVPERVANLWLDWRAAPAWTVGAGLRHVGSRFADNANTLELPSYTTVDLALRWQAGRDTSLALRGFNVFDRFYFTTAYYTTTQWLVGEGRRVELALTQRF